MGDVGHLFIRVKKKAIIESGKSKFQIHFFQTLSFLDKPIGS